MTKAFIGKRIYWIWFALIVVCSFCSEVDAVAYGYVIDQSTLEPVANAKVVEIAVFKKKKEIICEAYTDSLGYFEICNWEQKIGMRSKPKLDVSVSKDGYYPSLGTNLGDEMRIVLYPE